MKKQLNYFIGLTCLIFIASCKEKTEQKELQIQTASDLKADSIAIMKAIETETRNFYKKDHAAWSNSYVHTNKVH